MAGFVDKHSLLACSGAPQKLKEVPMHKRNLTMSFLAAAGVTLFTFSPALADEALQPQTRQDLKTAMQNESLAVQKYTAFAQHARNEGKIALAELLEQTAKAEQRHFMEAARQYGLARQDWHNLSAAIVSEYGEYSRTYAQMAERAEAAGDKETARSFRDIAADEEKHHRDFMAAVDKSLKSD